MENRQRTKIDRAIALDEIFLRCLVKLLMKKGKDRLQHTAVLPPSNNDVVSVLRLKYIEETDAVKHGKSIAITGNTFWGIAKITTEAIDATNEWALSPFSQSEGMDGVNGIQAKAIASPMYNGHEYIPEDIDVYMDDTSIVFPLQAHAELKYNEKNSNDIKTRIRAYANQLIKKISYRLIDESDNLGEWISEKTSV